MNTAIAVEPPATHAFNYESAKGLLEKLLLGTKWVSL